MAISVFRSFGETRPGNNQHPQLDSVIRIASLSKLMTSEMLVKLLDRGGETQRSAEQIRPAGCPGA